MNNVSRVISMAFIWGAVFLITTAAMFAPVRISGGEVVPMVVFLMIAATVATRFVWQHADQGTMARPAPERLEKAKRDPRGRLIQLINTMDEDEAAALLGDMRQRLSTPNTDGEISTIDSLLNDYERSRSSSRGQGR